VLRSLEAAFTSAPYLLCGLLMAGVLRILVGRARLQRMFSGDALSGTLRGWGFGLLLPVCSLGVLPVARELLRADVSRRTVCTLLLTAPLFNPLTLAYALSVMELPMLLLLLAASLVAAACASQFVGAGAAAAPSAEPPADLDSESVPYGLRRMAAILTVAADHWRSPLVWEVLLALIGIGLVGGLLDASTVGAALSPDSLWAAPLAIGLGTSLYVTSEQSIGVLDGMFGHGNSFAAALALLVCGVGLNLGTLAALKNLFGFRAALSCLVVFAVSVAVLGSVSNSTIYQPSMTAVDDHAGHDVAGHTHAFDTFARPAALNAGAVGTAQLTRLIGETVQPSGTAAIMIVSGLGLGAWFLRRPTVRERWLQFLTKPSPAHRRSRINRPLPEQWVTTALFGGGISLAYLSAIIYFPAPEDVFEDMQVVRAEALSAVKSERTNIAHGHFVRWERLSRKLTVGALLRGSANGDQRVSAQLLRQSLAEIRSALSAGDQELLLASLENCHRAYQQCRDVFAGQPLVLHPETEPGMPTKVTDDAERALYLTAAGIYTESDIAANGNQTASQRYAGFRSAHVMNPPVGSLLCPVTFTKANPACTWVVNGQEYQFCCPPCIDEFVRTAKESPTDISPPDEYIKR
jgi:uncharacterized membrane protein YraQ (UPF0718 family)